MYVKLMFHIQCSCTWMLVSVPSDFEARTNEKISIPAKLDKKSFKCVPAKKE